VEDITLAIGERRAFVPPGRFDEIKALKRHDDCFAHLHLPLEKRFGDVKNAHTFGSLM